VLGLGQVPTSLLSKKPKTRAQKEDPESAAEASRTTAALACSPGMETTLDTASLWMRSPSKQEQTMMTGSC
jgi:hypothetical protein